MKFIIRAIIALSLPFILFGSVFVTASNFGQHAALFDPASAVFTAGTYSWVVHGGNTIGNDANTLLITYVDDDAGAYLSLADAEDLNTDLTVNTRYHYCAQVKVGAGDSVDLEIAKADETELDTRTITSTEWVWVDLYFLCSNVATDKVQCDNMGAGEVLYIDNQSLRLGDHRTAQAGDVTWQAAATTWQGGAVTW